MGVLAAKILAMATSLATGFIGGPVMPPLFIGGAAGVATHVIFRSRMLISTGSSTS